MYVCVYSYRCMHVGICVCNFMHVWVLSMYLCLHVWLVACYSVSDSLGRSGPVTGDPDPIGIRAHCGPETQTIRRPIHGMSRRSVPVCAVKTRRWFSSEIASFHVSVRFYVFTVVSMHLHVTLIILCDFLLYFTCLITCTTSWDVSEHHHIYFTDLNIY